jgi:hypothetical protein
MDRAVQPDERSTWVRFWLRGEGLIGLTLGWIVWQAAHGEPIWFLVLLITPDLSMLGYLRGPAVGAFTYNLAHNWLVGGLLVVAGLLGASPLLGQVGAILVAHTGVDRLLGYGLKYPSSFQDTHLGRIGRGREAGPER